MTLRPTDDAGRPLTSRRRSLPRVVHWGLFAVAACFVAVSFTSSSVHAADVPAADEVAFFESKVRPLLLKRCGECHSEAGALAKKPHGGLRLDRPAGIKQGGDSGPALVAGKPDESLLVQAIGYESGLEMPPQGKLPADEIAILVDWVKRGATLPEETGAIVAKAKIDFDHGRKFWSFQPLHRQPPPATKLAGWSRTSTDPFLLAAMETAGLQPSPEADRRTLVRRATFDLTGLPPTPEEAARFIADEAPDAYERLLERLLASPRYGERWGRYRLDLARYVDKPAIWDSATAQAWLYRDWIAQALNDDLSYDDFVRRQLAADLMPGAAPADAAALGFLGLSPTLWKELQLDHKIIAVTVAEEWEEHVDALGRTFLGLTVACARCHDHKFDPISTEDYYAVAGVLASTRMTERAIIPEPAAAIVRQATVQVQAWQAEIKRLKEAKPQPPEAATRIDELTAQVEITERSTPNYRTPLAFGLDEAALHVLGNGPGTKLDYRPGQNRDLEVQIRGNPNNLGPIVPRRFLTVLSPGEAAPFGAGSGRLALANSIVGEAAPLAARVMVNRVWKLHFGRGIVETPSDFGVQGARPSHPALLDDLAVRFVAAGWSLKWLHRELMLSAAYRQSSAHDDAKFAVDPDNRFYWRASQHRLEVEAWRDAMLAASGMLDGRLGGPSVELTATDNFRRTVYGRIDRYNLNDMLRLYDFPDALIHNPGRTPTTTALQQLFVLNSSFVERQSQALAERVIAERPGNTAGQITRAYELLFARAPTDHQLAVGLKFLTAGDPSATPSPEAWRQWAQVLLSTNEFAFID